MRYYDKTMLKRLGLVFLWFLVAPVTIAILAISLQNQEAGKKAFISQPIVISEDTAGPNIIEGQVLAVKIEDMRPYIVEDFLKNTALESHSEFMVKTADKYGIDYRLIPAISMKETGGGNASPSRSYNAWGFGNGSTQFTSWEGAIESVAKTLKEKYIDRGMVTPEEIMPVYAPPQMYTGGKWAKDINFFFSQMESL